MPYETKLPNGAINTIFPFHFVLNAELCIVGLGPSVPLILPQIDIGLPIEHCLQLKRPHPPFTGELIRNNQHSLFVFRCNDSGLLLRGQFIYANEVAEQFIFVGSPWLSDVAQLQQHRLSLSNFAVHDATADLLQAIQDEKTALEEARYLTQKLKKQRAVLQSILNTAADAIITINQQGLIESFNPAAEQMFAWQSDAIIGQSVLNLAQEPHASFSAELISDFLKEAELSVMGKRREVSAKRSDGSEFPAELSLSVTRYDDELHFTGIVRDVTLRNSQQAALAAARERELKMGHDIQQSLLFGAPIKVPGMEISAFTQPSQGVDGDFFDFFPIEPGCFDVLTGDVMGKGIAAAMIGAALKNQYTRIMAETLWPSLQKGLYPTCETIINQLHTRITPELRRLESFVTLIYARIDVHKNTLHFINAGHPEGLLFHDDGRVEMLSGDNLPIGIDPNEHYDTVVYEFKPGDLLLLFSDGVTEARNINSELIGTDPIIELVRPLFQAQLPAAIVLQRLRQIVDLFENSHQRSDDFTAISLYRHPISALHSQEFPRNMQVLAEIRHWLSKRVHLTPTQHDKLNLAAIEVATNIIRHVSSPLADTSFVLHLLQLPTTLTLEFYYVGAPFDPTQAEAPDFSGQKEGGFGLFIIQNCVDQVDYLIPAEQVNLIRLQLKDLSNQTLPLLYS